MLVRRARPKMISDMMKTPAILSLGDAFLPIQAWLWVESNRLEEEEEGGEGGGGDEEEDGQEEEQEDRSNF